MANAQRGKVYLYTRVSTLMQVDGYSLDAQKNKMKAFCDYNNYEIVGEYEDAGKTGKSIEGCLTFNRMIEDIKVEKDDISAVSCCRNREGEYPHSDYGRTYAEST